MRMRHLFTVALLLPMAAFAQNSATLQWTPPSEFTDGSELVPERDLEGYGVYLDGVRVAIAPPNVTTFVLEGVVPYGEHEFFMTSIAKNGKESAASNSVVRNYPDNREPKPPTLLDVLVAFVKKVIGWIAALFA